MTKPLHEFSASEAAAAIAAGRITSTALVEACLAQIEAREPTVKAWAHFDRAYALGQAKARDAEKPVGPLHGVPVGVKDIIDTADLPTEYGSAIYAGHRPDHDAACVALVRRAGGIIMGKTVTTEFATFHPGKTANPRNPAHTPGGSSSGSAAAVADFHVPIAFGTQTAGSINRPAAYCGAVGFKPSFGTYAISGVKALAASFDTLGTITRTVEDALLMWRALQAGDLPPETPLPARPYIALCQTPFWSAASPPAREAWRLAGQKLAAADFDVDEVELPEWFETLEATHKLVLDYETARTYAYENEKARRDKLSSDFRDMVERGLSLTPQRYMEARRDMVRARQEFTEIASRYDALMTPAAPGEAPSGLSATGNPIFNRLPTVLHVPSLNLPVTTGPKGLPLGVQFIGAFDTDLTLLQLGQLMTGKSGAGLSPLDLGKLLPDIVAIARLAGEEIMKIYSGAFDVKTKADASPLTAADDVSEALILAHLKALTPDIPIASEEATARGESATWTTIPERFWLVDPLDGTREFVSRNGEFSVNIGLIVARKPALGVVLAPATGETWAAAGPGTATLSLGSQPPRPIRARRAPPSGIVVLESRNHGDHAAVDAFVGETKVAERRAKGSALKFGVLAQGDADLYPRFGPTMEWDTAAGHAVLEAAGGRIETLAGAPLLYGKTGLRNPDFIAHGAS